MVQGNLQANFVGGWFIGFTRIRTDLAVIDTAFAKLEAELLVEEIERMRQTENILNLKLKKKNRIARQSRA